MLLVSSSPITSLPSRHIHSSHSTNPKASPDSVAVGSILTIRAPEHLYGTLAFSVCTSRPTPEKASPGKAHINVNTHSYLPTSPVAPSPSSSQTLSVPSPHEIKAKQAKLHAITPQNPTTVTHFIFYPSLPLPTSTSPAPFTFFSRAWEIQEIERQLAVDPGFWVAVVLEYLEFRTERDSYLAAANG
ncbi:hypothetical protein JB92DRAFT_3103999 [Gautieria morchelliformis]|nr:hypothetical protein JB92DRAFT_3103999 [Gautieria morchelliformis]